jgi:hypothetical protein
MEAELPEEKIQLALAFYNLLGSVAQAGFKSALTNCKCHVCTEIIQRIECGDLR